MRIVVDHLTRMRAGCICVAGIDLDTHEHVRPVLQDGQLGRRLLLSRGGLFDIGCVVDLGRAYRNGRPPEVEDRQFAPRYARRVETMAPAAYWALLEEVARPDLAALFGPDLYAHGSGYAVDIGKGSASLGCLRPTEPPVLTITEHGKVRIRLADRDRTAWLTVTDLRLCEDDHSTVRVELVQRVQDRIRQGVGVILGVGLGRAWSQADDDKERHWLQVNNLHLQDDPLWQECQSGAEPVVKMAVRGPVRRQDRQDDPKTKEPVAADIDHVEDSDPFAFLFANQPLPMPDDTGTTRDIGRTKRYVEHMSLHRSGASAFPVPGLSSTRRTPGAHNEHAFSAIRARHANAYMPWTEGEEALLRQRVRAGMPVKQMADLHGRKVGAICSRLKKLGLMV